MVLLPDAGGKSTSVTVTNPAGEQTLTQPYQAVRVESSGAAPGQPFAMDEPEVRRIFGGVLDTLPPAEVVFKLYFTENSDTLSADSDAQIQAVLDAIRDR
ncbi:MAG TPA: hypothetical protein VGS58_05265, partial [Candidatus Sulfopaludibacter sp.]|nr:hypothetical protein [Candidatus Sulfopaludibacter sp.]